MVVEEEEGEDDDEEEEEGTINLMVLAPDQLYKQANALNVLINNHNPSFDVAFSPYPSYFCCFVSQTFIPFCRWFSIWNYVSLYVYQSILFVESRFRLVIFFFSCLVL